MEEHRIGGMINHQQNIFLSLIRSALWNTVPEDLSDKEINWKQIYRLGTEQTLLGLLSSVVTKLPDHHKPDAEVFGRLRMFMIMNIQAHAILDRKLVETDRILKENGIFPVLFKGQGLARIYHDPLLRQCGDIDLYVGKSEFERACKILIDTYGKGEHDSESVKHYHMSSDDVTIELHRIAETLPGIRRNSRFQQWTRESLTSSKCPSLEIGGRQISVPPANFNAIYIMNHAWHHFINGGIGLRQLCDWALYLHCYKDEIDDRRLEVDLKAFGLRKVWDIMGGIAVEYLGLPEKECPLYEGKHKVASARLLDFIFQEGNFGKYGSHHKTPRPEGYAAGKLHSFRKISKRYLRILNVYPSLVLESWGLYLISGVYHYFKGLK